MPAQCKKVLLDAHLLQPQQLRHALRNHGFQCITRGQQTRRRFIAHLPQRLPVELAVAQARQPRQCLQGTRQHHRRQLPGKVLADRVQGSRRGLVAQADIRAQRFSITQHRRLDHLRCTRQLCLDLRQLDAEAAYLHLMVAPALQLDSTVRAIAGQVAGAVKPLARHERALDERRRVTLHVLQVAATHLLPTDIQFAQHAGDRQLQVLIQHIDLVVGQHLRQPEGAGRYRPNRVHHDPNRGFGRAVMVEQLAVRTYLQQALQQRRARGFPAQDDGGRYCRCLRLQQRAQVRRHDLQAVDCLLLEVRSKQFSILHHLVGGHVQCRTHIQGCEQRRMAKVGRHRRAECEVTTALQRQRVAHACGVVQQLPVLDHHAFGGACRARGEQDIGGIAGAGGVRLQPCSVNRQRVQAVEAQRLYALLTQAGHRCRFDQHLRGAGLCHQAHLPGNGPVRLQRQVGCADTPTGQHRHDPVQRTRQRQCQHRPGLHASLLQRQRQALHCQLQLGVTQARVTCDQCQRVGGVDCPLADLCRQ
ncbi:hypothetical protein D3C80_544780 [compost metagenome]